MRTPRSNRTSAISSMVAAVASPAVTSCRVRIRATADSAACSDRARSSAIAVCAATLDRKLVSSASNQRGSSQPNATMPTRRSPTTSGRFAHASWTPSSATRSG